MIAKKEVKKTLDIAATAYESCWETLCEFKSAKHNDDFLTRLINFQPLLCKGMLELEKTRYRILEEKRGLIDRKANLSEKWFDKRMKDLDKYKKALTECTYIGKSLGDSFVWIFYQNERVLLREHLRHKEIRHLPVGIGGLGELEFIKGVKKLGDCFIIYHGITSILRHGDISLF